MKTERSNRRDAKTLEIAKRYNERRAELIATGMSEADAGTQANGEIVTAELRRRRGIDPSHYAAANMGWPVPRR